MRIRDLALPIIQNPESLLRNIIETPTNLNAKKLISQTSTNNNYYELSRSKCDNNYREESAAAEIKILTRPMKILSWLMVI